MRGSVLDTFKVEGAVGRRELEAGLPDLGVIFLEGIIEPMETGED